MSLQQALGLKGRYHIALESDEDITNVQQQPVVLVGPLSDAYTAALNEVFDKSEPAADPIAAATGTDAAAAPAGTNPAEGTATSPEGAGQSEPVETGKIEEVTAVVLESQAQDAVILQSLHEALTPQEQTEDQFMTVYAVDQTKVTPENVTEVTKLLAEAEQPENVVLMLDENASAPIDQQTANLPDEEKANVLAATEQSEKLATSLESLTVAMGGKVVHNLAGLLELRKVAK